MGIMCFVLVRLWYKSLNMAMKTRVFITIVLFTFTVLAFYPRERSVKERKVALGVGTGKGACKYCKLGIDYG